MTPKILPNTQGDFIADHSVNDNGYLPYASPIQDGPGSSDAFTQVWKDSYPKSTNQGWGYFSKRPGYASKILAKTHPLPVIGNTKVPPFSSSITRVHTLKGLFRELNQIKEGHYALVLFSSDRSKASTQYRATFQRLAKEYAGNILMIEASGTNGGEENWLRLGVTNYPTLVFIDQFKVTTIVDPKDYEDPMRSHPYFKKTKKVASQFKRATPPLDSKKLNTFDPKDIQHLASQRNFFAGILPILEKGNKNPQIKPLKFKWSDPESGYHVGSALTPGSTIIRFQHVIDTDSNPVNGRIYLVDSFVVVEGKFLAKFDRSFFYKKGGQAARLISTESGKYRGMGEKSNSEAFNFFDAWVKYQILAKPFGKTQSPADTTQSQTTR